MKARKDNTALYVVFSGVVLAGVLGYALNVVALFQCDFQGPYRAEVLRGVGAAIPPVGAIIGYLEINDDPKE